MATQWYCRDCRMLCLRYGQLRFGGRRGYATSIVSRLAVSRSSEEERIHHIGAFPNLINHQMPYRLSIFVCCFSALVNNRCKGGII